ncbi:MAG: MarR family winged helix-turn-helix transcriptional regulator [Planctomycetota bacterium]|jgi:DNA-binding MarR family transcriptional regulator
MQLHIELGLPEDSSDIRHETLLNIVRTATLISATGARIFREFGLTEAQFNVLLLLKYKDRELTQTELGERLGITRASTTSVLDKLEGKGLISRESVKGNRRIYHVALKVSGLALLDKVEPVYREKIGRIMGPLSDKECQTVMKYLGRIRTKASEIIDEHRAAE